MQEITTRTEHSEELGNATRQVLSGGLVFADYLPGQHSVLAYPSFTFFAFDFPASRAIFPDVVRLFRLWQGGGWSNESVFDGSPVPSIAADFQGRAASWYRLGLEEVVSPDRR